MIWSLLERILWVLHQQLVDPFEWRAEKSWRCGTAEKAAQRCFLAAWLAVGEQASDRCGEAFLDRPERKRMTVVFLAMAVRCLFGSSCWRGWESPREKMRMERPKERA